MKGTIKMALNLSDNNVWTVSFLIADAGITDPALQKIVPLTFTGTSAELGDGFFDALAAPVQQRKALVTNIEAYEKSVKDSTKAAKMNQPATKTSAGSSTPTAPKAPPRYTEKMKKVAELESKGKYGEAIGALPKAADFPGQADEIAAKLKALKEKHGGLSLFPDQAESHAGNSTPEQEEVPEGGGDDDPDPGEEDPDQEQPEEDLEPTEEENN